jgi:pyruvate dehydrogenase E2 component (dihydrolipoamide acetyltransferase)
MAALAAKASEKKAEPETVEIAGGRKIRYLKLGNTDGPPIVFVHGFGGDLNNWLFNQEALAEHHTAYAIDLPGHGGSTKDVGAGDLASMTAALAAWMDALKIARAHLVGHSMGGAVKPATRRGETGHGGVGDANLPGRARPGHRDGLHQRLHRG